MKNNIFVAGFVLISLSGCATIVNGTHQDVRFNSEPGGAVVALIDGKTCTTPCEFSMRRGDDSKVNFNKDGFKPEYVYIQSRTSGATFGNIIAGGLIGGVVDGSNGASNHLYPVPVYIRLVPTGSSEEAVLLDKGGKVISTVAAYNEKVRVDVEKGLQKNGAVPKTTNGK
jgi:hypothetical protein